MTSSAATWVSAKWNRDDDKCGGGRQEAGWQTWRTGVTGRRGKGGGKEDTSVLQGSQVKLVCGKLKWHGETVTDVAWAGAWSVSRGLKRALTDTCCAHSRVGPISERQEIKSGEKMGWRGDMKLISHPINVTDDTQHNISACRGPRGPWEMNICPIDLSHLIQS